jgi:RNA polymerase sigma-70 factor (ECF subfamily)
LWDNGLNIKGHRISGLLLNSITSRNNIWIKNDPPFIHARKGGMLIASHDINCADLRPTYGVRKDMNKVKPPPTQVSAQTTWMLAVREHRDRAAFSALFDHFAPRLKGFVMRSGTGSAQAEEIVQEVLLTVWRKAEQFDPARAQVSAWIYQIARNRQIDVIRKEGRPLPDELRENPATEPDASQILAVEQEANQLKQALERLKPDQREIIRQAYLGELTQQEISTQTGLPLGTIKSRIRLGLERLRHELKDLR